jgi:hypothetical protein
MRHQPPQRRGDRVQQFVQIKHGNDRIVHFEQQVQTIALFLELLLNRLRLFEVERVVHCDRYLSSYLL